MRPLGPDDRAAIRLLLEELSPASRALRFGGPLPRIDDRLLDRLCDCDGERQTAWGAWAGGRLVGMGRIVRFRDDPGSADFALTVADRWQGQGIGRLLLERLARAARASGVWRLTYYVTGSNARMLRLLRSLGERYRIVGGAAEGGVAVDRLLEMLSAARAA